LKKSAKVECYLSTSCFNGLSIVDAVKKCGELGVFNVELSAFHPHESLSYLGEQLSNFKLHGFNFALHNYFPPPQENFVLNIASNDDEIQKLNWRLVKNAFSLATEIDARLYGIHAGYLADGFALDNGMFQFSGAQCDYKHSLENAASFVRKAANLFDQEGVAFLLENLFPSEHGQYSLFCTFQEIKDFMGIVPESVGLLLDLGHLNISSCVLEFSKYEFLDKILSEYGDRIFEIHFSENNGKIDEHLPLTKDSWQLDALNKIQTVRTSNCKRIYCLESRNSSLQDLRISLNILNEKLLT